jgi:uncharacterized membrane protein YoaT (DUF817 family)
MVLAFLSAITFARFVPDYKAVKAKVAVYATFPAFSHILSIRSGVNTLNSPLFWLASYAASPSVAPYVVSLATSSLVKIPFLISISSNLLYAAPKADSYCYNAYFCALVSVPAIAAFNFPIAASYIFNS